MPITLASAQQEEMLSAARAAFRNAHAPYSNFKVGATILTERGTVYHGCNVENASYGLTICAERNAIFAAVAAEGSGMRIKAVPWPPSATVPAPRVAPAARSSLNLDRMPWSFSVASQARNKWRLRPCFRKVSVCHDVSRQLGLDNAIPICAPGE